MEEKDYKSRIFRTRVSALFIIIFGALLYLGWVVSKISGSLVPFFVFCGAIVFAGFAFRSLYYVLTDKEIHFFYLWGIMGKPIGKIHISAITSVVRSYNPLPASAASLKRLHIHFKRGYKWHLYLPLTMYPMISPVREQEFLEMLKEINPNIQIKVNDKNGWWRFWDWDF